MSMNFFIGDTTGSITVDVYQTRTQDTEMILGGKLQSLRGQAALDAVHRYFELMRDRARQSQYYYKRLSALGKLQLEDWMLDSQMQDCQDHIDQITRFVNFVGVENLQVGYM